MSRKAAFWMGWACGSLAVWIVLPEVSPFVWIPACFYAAVEFFEEKR